MAAAEIDSKHKQQQQVRRKPGQEQDEYQDQEDRSETEDHSARSWGRVQGLVARLAVVGIGDLPHCTCSKPSMSNLRCMRLMAGTMFPIKAECTK